MEPVTSEMVMGEVVIVEAETATCVAFASSSKTLWPNNSFWLWGPCVAEGASVKDTNDHPFR